MNGVAELSDDIVVVEGLGGDRLQYTLVLERWCDRRLAGADSIANAFRPGSITAIREYLEEVEASYVRLRVKASNIDWMELSLALREMGMLSLSELKRHPSRWPISDHKWGCLITDDVSLNRVRRAFGSPDSLMTLKVISITLKR